MNAERAQIRVVAERLHVDRSQLGRSFASAKTEFTRDSAILRFKLAYEVTWKLLQLLLREQGYEVLSPRQAFQQAFAIGWIADEVVWDDIIRARNTAVHVYRESEVEALYRELAGFQKHSRRLVARSPSLRHGRSRAETRGKHWREHTLLSMLAPTVKTVNSLAVRRSLGAVLDLLKRDKAPDFSNARPETRSRIDSLIDFRAALR